MVCLSTCLCSANIVQPVFDSKSNIWSQYYQQKEHWQEQCSAKSLQELDLSSSPFFKHHSKIAKNVIELLRKFQDKEALKFLRKTIDMERHWRRHSCEIFFGALPCRMGIGAQPFGIWRKRMVNYLVSDPTDEIVHLLRSEIVPKIN